MKFLRQKTSNYGHLLIKKKIKQDNSHLNPNNRSVRTEQEDEFFKKFSSNLPKGFEINK